METCKTCHRQVKLFLSQECIECQFESQPNREQPLLCFETMAEDALDEALALGHELAQLRSLRETTLKAAKITRTELILAKQLIAGVAHYQAEAALAHVEGALSSTEALIQLITEGGEQ